MSRKLLEALNGGSRGAFRSWLDNFQGEPRIAWYPSAGEDFRDTLYLHPNFAKLVPSTQTEPSSPDIFLHTDYFPWKYSNFLDTRRIYVDDRTSVYLKSMEELPNCNLPLDSGIVGFSFWKLRSTLKRLGSSTLQSFMLLSRMLLFANGSPWQTQLNSAILSMSVLVEEKEAVENRVGYGF